MLLKNFFIEKKLKNQILILPSNYFYPYPNFRINNHINKYLEIEDISIGIHHWNMSWMKGSLINRIKNKLKLYFKFNKIKMKRSYKLLKSILNLFRALDRKRKYQFFGIIFINILNGLF